jgi:hypothetical protein
MAAPVGVGAVWKRMRDLRLGKTVFVGFQSVISLLGGHPDVYIFDQGVVAVCGGAELGKYRVLL